MKNLRARVYTTAFSNTVLALFFAALWTGIQSFEIWNASLEVIPGETTPVALRLPSNYFRITMLRNEFHYLNTRSSVCPNVIAKGKKLDKRQNCAKLAAAYEKGRRPINPIKLLGYFGFFLVIGWILSAYMRRKRMSRARFLRSQLTVFFFLTVMAASLKAFLLLSPFPAQLFPAAFVPMLSGYFLKRRLSFAVALSSALLAASMVNFDTQMLLIYLVTGASPILAFSSRRRPSQFIKAGIIAALVCCAATFLTTLVFNGNVNIYNHLTDHFDPRYSLWIVSLGGGLSAGIVARIFEPLAGAMFGEVSRTKLLDLQDLAHPLLKRLRERAPGTWEHSRSMANLAEAAAHSIGGNALLARAGAYYHDVGKSSAAEFFIENQQNGENPHNQLSPHESCRAIFKHVSEGVTLLRQENVPEDVIEFAYSHHGTSILEFFYHKNMADGNPGELTKKDFAYPGHKPTTRETGILMIVDAMEAASRTVDEPDRTKFETLLNRIAFSKIIQGQLDESGLTISDLHIVSRTITDALVSMYHGRIKYPWQTEKKNETDESEKRESSSDATSQKKETLPRENSPTSDESIQQDPSKKNHLGQKNSSKKAIEDTTAAVAKTGTVTVSDKKTNPKKENEIQKFSERTTFPPPAPLTASDTSKNTNVNTTAPLIPIAKPKTGSDADK